jgi:hypothetical protein
MEHTINLAAGCFVTTVLLTSAHKLLKKIKAALKCAQLEGKDVDLDALEADLEDVNVEGDWKEDDDNDKEFGVGDTIRKALALVKQVCYLAALVSDILLTGTYDRFVHHCRLTPFLLNRVSRQMFLPLS